MKPVHISCALLILIASCLAQESNAPATDCGSSPRVVGAFGAMDKPLAAVPVSDAIRTQLPDLKVIRAVRHTSLAPSGEQMVMYDTSADEFAPKQKIAVIANGAVASTFDVSKLVRYGEQAIYQASCQFELFPGQNGFVIAYIISGDGTGSAFIILAHIEGSYRLVFARLVGQGRLVFRAALFELWERSFDKSRSNAELDNFECEWCDHRYLISKYSWRSGRYVKIASTRTKATYDPASITGIPVIVRSPDPATK